MGQRFGGAAALVRKSALEWGRSQIGSENYNYRAALGKWKNPSWKCNAFVIRAFNHNVIPETIGEKANPETWGLTSRAYLAREFYNGEVPGFELVDTPLPGDICADGSHVGIVSSRNTTISATETGVVENDWGFRLKDKKKIRFFRYKGAKK